MRLICPNCGAQYEVPAEVIPQGGRDVQCSDCAHTWYQAHPDDDPELARARDHAEADEDWLPEDEPEAEPEEFAEEPDPEAEPGDDLEPEEEPDPEPEYPPEPERRARSRALDPSVAEVLREEAEREARRRAAEADALESQPELGLAEPDDDEAARRSRESRQRMAHLRREAPSDPPATEAAAGAAAATAAGSRREMLPDIEEINQTLRASSERRSMETVQGRAAIEEEEASKSGGFGRGFRLVLALAIVAIAAYMLAPRIVTLFPGTAPAMAAYVAKIDQARIWLDDQIAALLPSE